MPARLYPKTEHKICKSCGKIFERNKNYYGKKWENTVYCSNACFGKEDGKKRTGMDEKLHNRWKGDTVGYYGVHDWITKHFGQPKKCEVCGLDDINRKYHWANLNSLYKRNREDWKRMCVSCHRKYDYARARSNKIINITR